MAENRFTYNDLVINEARVDRIIKAQRELIEQFHSHIKDNDNEQLMNYDSYVNIEISDDLIRRNYLSSFIYMAMKGLPSYDYIGSKCEEDYTLIEIFQLVVKPKDELIHEANLIDDIPGNIKIPDLKNNVSLSGNSLEITINR